MSTLAFSNALFAQPCWFEVAGWQYAMLFSGEPFGFSRASSSAEFLARERNGKWQICLIVRDSNGKNVGSITTDYSLSGNLLQWRRFFDEGQPIKAQSIINAHERNVVEAVSLNSEGIELRSSLPFDSKLHEPSPAWVLRAAFASFDVRTCGSFLSTTLSDTERTPNWFGVTQVNWSVCDDGVETSEGHIEVWRLDGVEAGINHSYAVYVGKNNQGILRIDMNSSAGAVMLARAGA